MPCLCKFKDIHMSCFVALGGNCLVSNFVVLRSVFLLLICIFVSFVLFVQIFFFFVRHLFWFAGWCNGGGMEVLSCQTCHCFLGQPLGQMF